MTNGHRRARRSKGIPPWAWIFAILLLPLWLPMLIIIPTILIGSKSLWRRYGPISAKIETPPLGKRHATKGVPITTRQRRALSVSPESKPSKQNYSEFGLELQTINGKRSCMFFDLPWELREQIWAYVLHPDDRLVISNHNGIRRLSYLAVSMDCKVHRGHLHAERVDRVPWGLITLLKANRRL